MKKITKSNNQASAQNAESRRSSLFLIVAPEESQVVPSVNWSCICNIILKICRLKALQTHAAPSLRWWSLPGRSTFHGFGVGLAAALTHRLQEFVHLLQRQRVVQRLQRIDGGHHGVAFEPCSTDRRGTNGVTSGGTPTAAGARFVNQPRISRLPLDLNLAATTAQTSRH